METRIVAFAAVMCSLAMSSCGAGPAAVGQHGSTPPSGTASTSFDAPEEVGRPPDLARRAGLERLTHEPMGGEPAGHTVTDLGHGLYVFRSWTYRNIFLVTDDGVIATDPMNPGAAEALLGAIRQVTDAPIRYVVYSHNHHDHISGGNVLEEEGTEFVGHVNLLRQLRDHPSPAIPLPDVTFEDRLTLTLGGRALELRYFGPNHGDSLIVMRIPEENTLFIVDIVTPRRVAFRGMPDFWPDEWVRSLEEIEAWNADFVIPGHGPASEPAIEPATVVGEQRVYLTDLMDAVRRAMDAGTHSPDELRRTVELPLYREWRYYEEWLPMNVERIWAYHHMGW